jgi:hypothetical protein
MGAQQAADSPPGDIKLLPGYKHEQGQGMDARVGKIWKGGGFVIQYDIGKLAGNQAESQDKDNLL